MMRRIVVIGMSGVGKTTLAEKIAHKLNYRAIELDALHFLPNWQTRELEDFRAQVSAATTGDLWVASGNYSKVRDIVWTRADTVIWLRYPLRVSFFRLLNRTLRRVITREPMWGTGNVERWSNIFSTKKEDNILLWALDSYPRHARVYPRLFEEYAHLQVLKFRSQQETDAWFNALQAD